MVANPSPSNTPHQQQNYLVPSSTKSTSNNQIGGGSRPATAIGIANVHQQQRGALGYDAVLSAEGPTHHFIGTSSTSAFYSTTTAVGPTIKQVAMASAASSTSGAVPAAQIAYLGNGSAKLHGVNSTSAATLLRATESPKSGVLHLQRSRTPQAAAVGYMQITQSQQLSSSSNRASPLYATILGGGTATSSCSPLKPTMSVVGIASSAATSHRGSPSPYAVVMPPQVIQNMVMRESPSGTPHQAGCTTPTNSALPAASTNAHSSPRPSILRKK